MSEIDNQKIPDKQIAQGMLPIRSEWPRCFAVQTIEKRKVGIKTRLVERPVDRQERESILFFIQVAKLDAFSARIAHRVCQDEILHPRPAEPFDSDRLTAARDN